MIVGKVDIKNFRNINEVGIVFKKGINLIYGENCQGKTNLLEAVYYPLTGKTRYISSSDDLINHSKRKASSKIHILESEVETSIFLSLEREGKKELFENGEKRKSLGNFYREIPVATFLLDDVEKVKGPPEKRRQLLDEIIISMKPAYKYLKREFEKILLHRNALLKLQSKESLIEVWDKKFAESSYHLTKERENASVELNKKYEIVFQKHIGDKNVTSFVYDSNIKGKDILEIVRALKSNREKETRVGRSLIGPQRDDLRIVSGKRKNMRIFGAEGEQKLISIFIKLAQKEILKERTGMSPVLIVDDPFSEIDEKLVGKIIEALKESDQVILSSLRPDVLKEQAANLIEIEDGAVVSVG